MWYLALIFLFCALLHTFNTSSVLWVNNEQCTEKMGLTLFLLGFAENVCVCNHILC